jgi:hypothetical protein
MRTTHRKRWLALGGAFGAGIAAVVVSMLAWAGAGTAAGQAQPVNTEPPSINGTPQEGQNLHGDRGHWSNNPTTYVYNWLRCGKSGGNCATINGATTRDYKLIGADVGNTIRFRVRAGNASGSNPATSAPTAVIQKATAPPPPPPADGCPPGGNPDQVANLQAPATMIIDAWVPDPSIITRGTTSWTLKVHITSTCGGPVQGALVYGTATPFNQWTVPPEQPTGPDGYATLTFQRLTNFPVNNNQQLIAMFLRARKPGANVLQGITGYRLVSIPVDLNR